MRDPRSPLIATLLLGLAVPALAQTAGSVQGTVRDASGSPVSDAAVTARARDQGTWSGSATSGASGAFRIEPLPPGLYRLRVEHEGFEPAEIESVEVAINQPTVIDLALAVAGLSETVEVVARSPLISTGRSALAGRIDQRAIQALPLDGREFRQLVTLAPGATRVAAPEGEAGDVSIFGERPSAVSYLVDGADNNDPLSGGPFIRYTQDSIQEFEVVTTGYEAELGRAQGGVTNIVTRSGSNRLRGQLFGFLRSDVLDASNVPDQDPPQLERYQYGATLGGPLHRDTAFFFGSLERLDEARGTNIDRATIPEFVRDGLATPAGQEDFSLGPDTGRWNGMLKLDWTPSQRHRLAITANHENENRLGEIRSPVAGTTALPSAAQTASRRASSAILRHTGLLGESTFLESTFSWLAGRRGSNLEREDRLEPVLVLLQSGFLQTGAPFGGRQERRFRRAQLRQALTHVVEGVLGEHELKLGWDADWVDLEGDDQVTNDVEYSGVFLSPTAHADNETLFRRYGFSQSAARFFTLPNQPDGDLRLDIRDTQWSLFLQDGWKPGSGLTLDLGLRYDRSSLFAGDTDNFGPRFGLAWDIGERHSTVLKIGWGRFHDRNLLTAAATVPEKGGVFTRSAFDVALPRLGVDYTDTLIDLVISSGFPAADGTRGPAENPAYLPLAADLRDDPLALYSLLGIDVDDATLPPIVTADNIEALSGLSPEQTLALLEETYPGTDWEFFDIPGGSLLGDRVLSFFPRGPLSMSRDRSVYDRDQTPSTDAFSIGIEQELLGDLAVSVTYVRRRTRDLLTRRVVNLHDVPPGHPDFGLTTDGGQRVNQVGYDGVIEYDGIAVALRKRYRHRHQLMLSYTYSDARDNLLTGGVGSGFSNNNHPELDLGPSSLSLPHVLVASGLVDLPGDLRLSGIFTWRSGAAYSPRGVVDLDGDGLVDQRDTTLPRNAFRTRRHLQLDARLEKRLRLGDGGAMAVLVEAFNMFNRDNVASVSNVSGDDFGTPTNYCPGREIQLGLRYEFGS
jgi:hypothetical protein